MKSPTKRFTLLASVLFYIGIAASAWLLFSLYKNQNAQLFTLTYLIVGTTFLFGIIAVTLVSITKTHSVVYLEKSNAETERAQQNQSNNSKLNKLALQNLVDTNGANAQLVLNEICTQLQAGQAALYARTNQTIELKYGFALPAKNKSQYEVGEGLIGRVAAEGKTLYIDKLPENYTTVFSGLGVASPSYLTIAPLKQGNTIAGVIEIATFSPLTYDTLIELEHVGEQLATII